MKLGVHNALQNRITAAATAEVASLLSIMQVVELRDNYDERKILNDETFSARVPYSFLHDHTRSPS
jgi:hypothetical protein